METNTAPTVNTADAVDLLRRYREACRAANHPFAWGIACGYCIEVGEVIGDE
jgi:hypothetical protein